MRRCCAQVHVPYSQPRARAPRSQPCRDPDVHSYRAFTEIVYDVPPIGTDRNERSDCENGSDDESVSEGSESESESDVSLPDR